MHEHRTDPGPLRAGAATMPVDLSGVALPHEGFAEVLDVLEVRVTAVDDGSSAAAFAVVDLTSIDAALAASFRGIVAGALAIPSDHVVVVASHTFSAPHVRGVGSPPGVAPDTHRVLRGAYDSALREAATRARAAMVPATVAWAAGDCDINVSRDVPTADGWWLGADDHGDSDTTVSTVVLRDLAGKPLAALVGYAVQPGVLADSVVDGGRLISADLAGAAMRRVEEQFPGAVASFLVGTAGDQVPRYTAVTAEVDGDGVWAARDLGRCATVLVEVQGRRLGAAASALVESAPRCRSHRVEVVRGAVSVVGREAPPRERLGPVDRIPETPTEAATVSIDVVRIGDVRLVCVAPELTVATGRSIVARSDGAATMVVTMANGAQKYMADERAFDRATYAAQSSRFVRGSAERLADEAVRLLAAVE